MITSTITIEPHQLLLIRRYLDQGTRARNQGKEVVSVHVKRAFELQDGILVVYMSGHPNVSKRRERVAFFSCGTTDNVPDVRLEWDMLAEPR